MKKSFIKIFLILFIMFLGINSVNAASFNISVGSKSLTKGGSTKLTINASSVTGRFNISSSNSSVVSVSEDRAWIENGSYSITLNALNVGTTTITVTPYSVADSSGNAVTGAKTIQITVSLPREKSTDNSLKTLSVEGYEISPVFNKDVFDYSVTVPEGTTSVKVNALANESHASVSGAGNITVNEGINNVSVIVKAENGSTKTYNLLINVIDENPINVLVDGNNYTLVKLRNNITCPELFNESEVTIDENIIPACYNEKLDYILVGLKSEDGIIENYIYNENKYEKYIEIVGESLRIIILDYDGKLEGLSKVKSTINNVEYNVFRSDDQSKILIVYGINLENGKKDFYVYDTVNKTFSTYEKNQVSNLNNLNNTYLYVIIAFGIALLLSLVCIINLNISKKKLLRLLKNEKNNNEEVKNNKKKKDKKVEDENNAIIEDENKIEEEKTDMYDLFKDDKNKRNKKNKRNNVKE